MRKQVLGKRHKIPVKVRDNLKKAIDGDLKVADPNLDIELRQPASENDREIPDDSEWD